MAGFFDDPMMSMYGTTGQPGFMSNPGIGPFATNLGLALIAAGSGGGAPRSRFGEAAPFLSQAINAPMQMRQQEMMQKLYGAQVGKLEADAARQKAMDEGRINLRNQLAAPSMMPMSDMEASPQPSLMSGVPQANRQMAVSLLDSGVDPDKLMPALMPKPMDPKDRLMNVPDVGLVDISNPSAPRTVMAAPTDQTDIEKRAVAAGLKPGSPEYQKFISDATLRPQNNVTVSPIVNTGDSIANQIGGMVSTTRDKALGAIDAMNTINRIQDAAENANLGPGATLKTGIQQIAASLNIGGKDDMEKLANTRTVIQGLADMSLSARSMLKGQGTITDSETAALEKARAGKIDELTKPELDVILGVAERAAKVQYGLHARSLQAMEGMESVKPMIPFYQVDPLPARAAVKPRAQDNAPTIIKFDANGNRL